MNNTATVPKDSMPTTLQRLFADTPELSLHEVMKDPVLLSSFEKYLSQNFVQENLLFIEAMNQLRHEPGSSNDIEQIFNRIYETFVAFDAPLELNVNTQNSFQEKLKLMECSIITREDALDLLDETEQQVLVMLKDKLNEFLQTPLANQGLCQSKINGGPISSFQKRVLIVGGGFTGFTVASILDPMPLFHVTLIDTKDSFEYTPHIVTKIVSPEKASSLRFKHSSYIRNGKVIIGYAQDICEDGHCVKVNDEKVYFDYLVLGTGSSYAGQLKSSDSSSLYRTFGLNKVATDIRYAKQILIVGAGLVGCELAAAIGQKQHDSPLPHNQKVILAEARNEIIFRGHEKQQRKAQAYLGRLGVQVLLNEKITLCHIDGFGDAYRGSSGNIYTTKDYLILMATGVKLNTGFIQSSTNDPPFDTCIDSYGAIRVKPTLQVEHWKYNHIFAGGDSTNVVEEKTAYAATIAGVCIARNICRMEKGKDPIAQGTKGLLPPPAKTLHGVGSHGGIGKKSLSYFERKLAFFNPTWQVLKYFNENQFFKIIQETSKKSHILGRLPKALGLPMRERPYNHVMSESCSSLFSRSSNHSNTDLYDELGSHLQSSLTLKSHNTIQSS